MSDTLGVFSIFRSIQGESTAAGLPCVFVRLAGCPLACSYCDTAEARDAEGRPQGIDEIVSEVEQLGGGLVEVTGGEPLAQDATRDLLRALCDRGHQVLLETSGAFPLSQVDPRVVLVVDVKCPGSGMADRMRLDELGRLQPGWDQLKLVVTSQEDFRWAERLASEGRFPEGVERLVSPVPGQVAAADLAAWVLASEFPWRLQLQLHKIIWPDSEEER